MNPAVPFPLLVTMPFAWAGGISFVAVSSSQEPILVNIVYGVAGFIIGLVYGVAMATRRDR